MRDLLPPDVIAKIGQQYRRAVADAETAYETQRAVEDGLTSALGLALLKVEGQVTVGGVDYSWRTRSWAVRGNGSHAPESRYGADAYFELEVLDEDGGVVRRKLLPMQAKKEWSTRDGKLLEQVETMRATVGDCVVVNYKWRGYEAVDGPEAQRAEGTRGLVRPDQLQGLGALLADRFLTCEIGAIGLRYDIDTESLYGPDGQVIPGIPKQVVRTTVERKPARGAQSKATTKGGSRRGKAPSPRAAQAPARVDTQGGSVAAPRTGRGRARDAGREYVSGASLVRGVGDTESRTQRRLVELFVRELGYRYLGDLRLGDNRNIIESELRVFLSADPRYRGTEDGEALMRGAIAEIVKAAGNTSLSPYDRNRAVYELLRYGASVKIDVASVKQTVWLIDWKHPERNRFAIAEEVTVAPLDPTAQGKRPDLVLYVNGIALGVLELKRSTVSVAEGIRQNLSSQHAQFIPHFFSTMQLVMAGNDAQGLRYGTTDTKEKYFLIWKEPAPPGHESDSPLDQAVIQLCGKARFLEIIHDFVVFDAGTKKLCRHNQYFGVRAAQEHIRRREGGIIWHAQGSGKSLTMVWLARWLHEHRSAARVLIITDRTELDEQIEKVFEGVGETIVRTRSGADLVAHLGAATPWLLCSLIHKFGGKDDEAGGDAADYIREALQAIPKGWTPHGDLFVFVDECHRTQSGDLHDAMKALLPNAVFIGFTGTPLLKADKKRSIEIFGRYIHTYKFDEAVEDGVVLDLRYAARDIDQSITSQAKVDQWFEAKTKGLTRLAKAQLKARWGTMQKVLSSQSRLQKIVADILFDMELRERLASGRGNALLVAGSIYEACKFYELFAKSPLAGKVAIVTSYAPRPADIKGEVTGDGATDALEKYAIYGQMLADWFHEPIEKAMPKIETFEKAVKKKFVDEPGQMKLLIVVDKLLTGFDAPPATFLYIDKKMQDHGLFQAICRVNRLDGDDKEYGYIVDYKDLFKSLEGAVTDYTSGAFDGYDPEDVAGLLEDRVACAREDLEDAIDAVRLLCEPVAPPRDDQAYYRYFSSQAPGDAAQLQANEPQRLALYTLTAKLVRAYANLASEMTTAGYSEAQAAAIKDEVTFYENLRGQVKLHSGDAIDLKQYEPAMRHLIDTYIRADDSEQVSAFDDLSLIQLIVERGVDAVKSLPAAIRKKEKATAETIENNVRRLIIDETPINPKYYERMSDLLDALITQRRNDALSYQEYLAEIVRLTQLAKAGPSAGGYPATLNNAARRALFDNLGRDEAAALAVDTAVRASLQDDWRTSVLKTKRVRQAIAGVLGDGDPRVEPTLALVKSQHDY